MRRKRYALWLTALLLTLPARALGPGDVLTGVGRVVAIELETDGVIVAGFAQVDTENGSVSPASASGLQPRARSPWAARRSSAPWTAAAPSTTAWTSPASTAAETAVP